MKNNFTLQLCTLFFAFSLIHLTCFGQWEVLTSGTYANVSLDDIYASVTGDTIIAVGTDLNDSYTGYVLKSFDGGETWDGDIFDPGYLLKGISFANGSIGNIAVLGSVGCTLRSTNGGSNWNWHWCDTDYSGVYDIDFTSNQIGHMAGYGNQQFGDGNIYKTTDAGNTWQSISGNLPGKPFEFIEVADENVFYGGSFLFGNELLYKSIDAGISWESLNVGSVGCRDVHFHDADNGILLGNNAIYKTTDGGTSWIEVGTFPEIDSPVFASVVFTDAQNGYAFVNNSNNEGHIIASEDGGESWAIQDYSLPNGVFVKARAFNGRVYAVTATGKIVVTSPSSVGIESDYSDAPDFTISPNPTEQSFQVSFSTKEEPADYKLFDLSGAQVSLTLVQKEFGTLSFTMDESLPKGIYCFVMSYKNGHYKTKKIIKN